LALKYNIHVNVAVKYAGWRIGAFDSEATGSFPLKWWGRRRQDMEMCRRSCVMGGIYQLATLSTKVKTFFLKKEKYPSRFLKTRDTLSCWGMMDDGREYTHKHTRGFKMIFFFFF
jgi:hypothetical protein